MIAGPEDVYTARERQRGYQKALEENGLSCDDSLIARGNYTIAGGAAAMRKLRETNPDMTAVFISNYEMTVGAMMEINDLGIKIPEDISVIGFDNVDFAKASVPRLSIVTQPTDKIGREAANILIEKLETRENSVQAGEKKPEDRTTVTVTLKTGFVEGKSVRNLRQSGCTEA